MQKAIDIATGAFLIIIALTYLNAGTVFVNEEAACFTLLFTVSAVICRLSLSVLRKNQDRKLSITMTDWAFILFILWIMANAFLIKRRDVDPFLLYKLGAIAGFYILIRLTVQKKILLYSLVLSGVIQTVIAIAQKRGLLFSHNILFDVTGSFGNPGQLGGYLAVCTTLSLCLTVISFREKRIMVSILLFTGSVLQGLGLYLADSRAGWLGLFVGLVCGVFFIFSDSWKRHKITEERSTSSFRTFKPFIIGATVLFFTLGIILLYNYRPKSADARLLIWRVSCDMIMDSPLAGHGSGAFGEKYMLYQAAFFEKNPGSPFAIVADNAGHPFNELLNTVVCLGIIGAILLLFLLWTAFQTRASTVSVKIFRAGLFSWLTFSLFSYPVEVFPLLLLSVVCLGGIESNVKFSFKPSRWVYGTIILLLIVVLFRIWRQVAELKQLSGELIDLYESSSRSIDRVEHSYDRMKANPAFNNYYMTWMESQPPEFYTAKAEDALPSCEAYCMKGNYYLKIGKQEQAEQAFYTASNMVPTRIRPKYSLWKLYIGKEDTVAAREMARKILSCPLKTESIYTLKVKKEVKIMSD